MFNPRTAYDIGFDTIAIKDFADYRDEYVVRPQEFVQSGEEIAAFVQLRARGKGAQFDIEEEMADVFAIRKGRIARLRLYVRPGDALESIGASA